MTLRQARMYLMDEGDVRRLGDVDDMTEMPRSKAGKKRYAILQEKAEKAARNLIAGKRWDAR